MFELGTQKRGKAMGKSFISLFLFSIVVKQFTQKITNIRKHQEKEKAAHRDVKTCIRQIEKYKTVESMPAKL